MFFDYAARRLLKRRVHAGVVLAGGFSLTSVLGNCFSNLLNSLLIFGSMRSVRIGSKMWNVEPVHFSSSKPDDSTQIVPPCASMIPRVMGKPRPGPPPLNLVFPLECRLIRPTWPNFSKITLWFSGEIPMPVSAMVISMNPGRLRPSMVICPLSGVNLMALETTFLKA